MSDDEMKIYEDEILKCYNKKQKKHIRKVREISILLCNIAGIEDEDLQIVELGALLHDIGKSDNFKKAKYENNFACYIDTNEKHNKTGAKYVDKIKALDNLSAEDKKIIKKIIRYHRGKKIYKKNFNKKDKRLIAIVRLADKIAKIYKHKHNAKKSLKKLDECIENLPDWVKK